MGTHVQRKRFDALELASEAQRGFDGVAWQIPGVDVSAEVREIDGAVWLYVTQSGNVVTGDEPLLPEYEKVS